MTVDHPAVSVIIPLFQAERFIAETIASVLAQTVRAIEVIVIDDGSRDRGPHIARSTGDPRVRVVTQINSGVSAARNHGLRLARAPVVAFIDADDLWKPEKLEKHLAHLAACPDVGISYSASLLIDEQGDAKGLLGVPRGETTAAQLLCDNPLGSGSTPVLRRVALDAIAFDDVAGRRCWFDETLRQSEDIECWVRIAVGSQWRFAALDEPLTVYRLNSEGLSADVRRQLSTWMAFRAKLARIAPELDAAHGDRAEARQRRYLARKSVRNGEARLAARLMARAVWLEPSMVFSNPRETLSTIAATIASLVMPVSVYRRLVGARHAGRDARVSAAS